MVLIILYKNGREDRFSEKELDCSRLTLKGHASKLIDTLKTNHIGLYAIDSYNAVLPEEIISIRVV